MIEITLSTGEQLQLIAASDRKFRGTRLPGSSLVTGEGEDYTISIHHYDEQQFCIDLRQFHFLKKVRINIKEPETDLRMELILTGQFHVDDGKQEHLLLSGQYHVTDTERFQSYIRAGESIVYVSILFKPSLIEGMRMKGMLRPMSPRPMPEHMRDIVQKMLSNPFNEDLRNSFYENCVRGILFYHVAVPPVVLPGELTLVEIAACHAADQIIAENLGKHISIQELARMVGTNVFVLKNGFSKLFGIGVFERLVQLKMDKAIFLLQTTDMQVQEIAIHAGYDSLVGFIVAFKKAYGLSPKNWRKKNKGL